MNTIVSRLGRGLVVVTTCTWALAARAGEQGFYLGLEGGTNELEHQKVRIYDDPGGLLGLGAQDDGTQIASVKSKAGFLGGVTAGYAMSFGLRPEVEVSYRHNRLDKDTDTGDHMGGSENMGAAMLNLWFDFFKAGTFHPYLGGGAGYTKWKIKNPSESGLDLEGDDDKVFAWQAGAGAQLDLTPHLSAGAGYRYLRTEKGKFDLLDDNGSHVETRYAAHSVLLSVNYYFGGSAPAAAPPPAEEPAQVEVVPVAPAPEAPPAEPAPPPPPPAPACAPPEPGQPITLDGCKAGDTIVLRGVNFDFNKATLTANAKTILDNVADELGKHGDIKVELDGHTDSKGSDAYNEKLSQHRAESVRQYLVGKGIDAGRMTAKGFGESQPVADNATDEGRELNRRVELKIVEGGGGAVTAAPAADAAPPAAQ